MYHPPAPTGPPPPNTSLPPGWTTHWSAEHQRLYYMNNHTGETTWDLPSPPTQERFPTPGIKRKPVASPPMSGFTSADAGHQQFPVNQTPQPDRLNGPLEAQRYPGPPSQPQYHNDPYQNAALSNLRPSQAQYTPPYSPPQRTDASGYFPPSVRDQNGTPSQLYPASPYSPGPGAGAYQPQPLNDHTEGSVSQPSQYYPPPPTSRFPQKGNFAQSTGYPTPSPYPPPPSQEQPYFPPPPAQTTPSPHPFSPPITPGSAPSWQQNNPAQKDTKYPQNPSPQPYQPQYQNNFAQSVPQAHDQTRKSSSSGMMGKLGSKFNSLQKTVAPGSTASPLKKWGTRAALGIGAIGALALGADVMDGGLFDGGAAAAAASSSGFDTSGVDFGDTSSAQTALDASTVQLALEQQGRENALMLLDPPGTTYTVVNDNSLI